MRWLSMSTHTNLNWILECVYLLLFRGVFLESRSFWYARAMTENHRFSTFSGINSGFNDDIDSQWRRYCPRFVGGFFPYWETIHGFLLISWNVKFREEFHSLRCVLICKLAIFKLHSSQSYTLWIIKSIIIAA